MADGDVNAAAAAVRRVLALSHLAVWAAVCLMAWFDASPLNLVAGAGLAAWLAHGAAAARVTEMLAGRGR